MFFFPSQHLSKTINAQNDRELFLLVFLIHFPEDQPEAECNEKHQINRPLVTACFRGEQRGGRGLEDHSVRARVCVLLGCKGFREKQFKEVGHKISDIHDVSITFTNQRGCFDQTKAKYTPNLSNPKTSFTNSAHLYQNIWYESAPPS